MRPARKSRERGLFKECGHLWDRCECPWLGRFQSVRRVNLAAWSAAGRPLNRTEAIRVLGDVRSAVRAGTFTPQGKRPDPSAWTFGQLLDHYDLEEVTKRSLKDKALPAFLKAVRERFGADPLATVAKSPKAVEEWLEALSSEHKWSARTWNAYRTLGVRLFNWGKHPKQALTTDNPFALLSKRKGERRRDTRITEEQQTALLAVCDTWMIATRKGSSKPNVSLQQLGREMHRRLLAAFDTGLRAGEMLQVQAKHVDFTNWKITLPWDVSKGGKTTGQSEAVWVMSERLRLALEQRRFLKADAYVFGTDDGQRVLKFHKAWRRLFREAKLPDTLIWHDARHEFVSSLIEEGGTIAEVREAARHKSITTTALYMTAHEHRVKALLEKRAKRLNRT
jgi:integrase